MPSPDLIKRQTSLSANLVAFYRFLRMEGFRLGPAELADALEALALVGPFSGPEQFQACLKAALCRSRAQLEAFDELYEQYFRELEKAVDAKRTRGKDVERSRSKTQPRKNQLESLKSWLYGNEPTEEKAVAAYSPDEVLTETDFSQLSADMEGEMRELLRKIARQLARQYSRRREKNRRKGELDLLRSMRRNLRRGGEMIELERLKPRTDKHQLILLCDVSRSMELYSSFLIQFIYGMQQGSRRIETFVFATRLHRISEQLREPNFELALQKLSERIPDWSGGTRIGPCLQQFVEQYGQRLLLRRSTVIVLSDGWDTGSTEVLEAAMHRIHRKAGRVIWLNPLAGNPNFEPSAGGMQVALPYIDHFAAVHNLESLRKLGAILK